MGMAGSQMKPWLVKLYVHKVVKLIGVVRSSPNDRAARRQFVVWPDITAKRLEPKREHKSKGEAEG